MKKVSALGALLCCTPLFAQTDTGRILGSVYDQTQAVVPHRLAAALRIRNATHQWISKSL